MRYEHDNSAKWDPQNRMKTKSPEADWTWDGFTELKLTAVSKGIPVPGGGTHPEDYWEVFEGGISKDISLLWWMGGRSKGCWMKIQDMQDCVDWLSTSFIFVLSVEMRLWLCHVLWLRRDCRWRKMTLIVSIILVMYRCRRHHDHDDDHDHQHIRHFRHFRHFRQFRREQEQQSNKGCVSHFVRIQHLC